MVNVVKSLLRKIINPSRRLVGIDWGKEKIKVAVISWNGKLSVQGLYSIDLPAEVLNKADIQELNSDLVASLGQMADDAGINEDKIVLGLEGTQVSLRHIKIPVMPERQLAKAIKWEVEKYYPGLAEKITYRYLILGDIVEKKNKFYSVLLITVNNDTVEKYCAIFQAAGLNLATLDITSMALWNLYKKDNGENSALVYLSPAMLHIVIMQYNQIYFTRSISVYDLNNIIEQLEITLQYLKHTFPVPPVQSILLSGETENYPDLLYLLEERINIAVKPAVPVLLDDALVDPGFEIALGLALRGIPKKPAIKRLFSFLSNGFTK